MMAPAPEMKAVDFLAGNFKGDATFYFGGQKSSGPCKAKAERALNDHFMQSMINYKMAMPGMPEMDMAGMHLLTYDPAAKQYVSWWFDSTAAVSMRLTGNFAGDKLVLVSDQTDVPGMGKVVMRSCWWKTAKGVGFSLEMQNKDKWDPMMEGEMKKD